MKARKQLSFDADGSRIRRRRTPAVLAVLAGCTLSLTTGCGEDAVFFGPLLAQFTPEIQAELAALATPVGGTAEQSVWVRYEYPAELFSLGSQPQEYVEPTVRVRAINLHTLESRELTVPQGFGDYVSATGAYIAWIETAGGESFESTAVVVLHLSTGAEMRYLEGGPPGEAQVYAVDAVNERYLILSGFDPASDLWGWALDRQSGELRPLAGLRPVQGSLELDGELLRGMAWHDLPQPPGVPFNALDPNAVPPEYDPGAPRPGRLIELNLATGEQRIVVDDLPALGYSVFRTGTGRYFWSAGFEVAEVHTLSGTGAHGVVHSEENFYADNDSRSALVTGAIGDRFILERYESSFGQGLFGTFSNKVTVELRGLDGSVVTLLDYTSDFDNFAFFPAVMTAIEPFITWQDPFSGAHQLYDTRTGVQSEFEPFPEE